ncbi:hypothetical protein GCM10023175_15910 [Pseudonocardia xishanensis]|uniref:Uncharacterized protein n=1 Tax=Pseudonocardia xishanensis TaxID=630995 RepID=A0ABP8RKW2_9PSEU
MQVDVGAAAHERSEPEDDAGGEVTDLGEFVERLAERAPDPEPAPHTDPATAAAAEQVRTWIDAGAAPVGLRALAEAVAEQPETPAPRGEEDAAPADVVAAARSESFLILDGYGPEEVAAAASALAGAGLRVAVTAADAARLDAVPATVGGLPGLSGAEQRELRLLLATATPERTARSGQTLPPAPLLPSPADVAALCAHAGSGGHRVSRGPDVLRDVLNTLDEERFAAVAAVARETRTALDHLGPRADSWAWPLVADLVHGLRRQDFDALRVAAGHSLSLADASRDLPRVTLGGELPPGAVALLTEYRAHLDGGGRVPRRFRRDVAPVLDLVRVGGAVPGDPQAVRAVVLHLELAAALTAVDEGCRALLVPTPHAVGDLRALVDGLERVDHAVRTVGRLRHDVLFLHPSSPVQVPDLEAAEQIAEGIGDVAEHGSAPEAAARLDSYATALEGSGPAEALPAELRAAVDALRDRDPAAYAEALAALVPARRQAVDQARCDALLAALRSADAGLARSWDEGARGFVWTVPLEALLTRLPGPDQLDAVIVLDAAELAAERLLVAAAAPRLLAVAEWESHPGDGTLLGALQRAAAPRLRSARGPAGRLVTLPTARRPSENSA